MDIVYVCRDGENPELRYSLRTLQNVDHGAVFIFGGAPVWISDYVGFMRNQQRASPYASTRSHIKAACLDTDVSDPFMLWNDDFYAMRPTTMQPMHRGLVKDTMRPGARTPWFRGLEATAALLARQGNDEPLMYDVHVPMVIHKEPMLKALDLARKSPVDAVHLRTVYGNLLRVGGVEITDPKMMRRDDPFPTGPWLSSNDNTFKSTVEPVLRYLFPDPCKYERAK